MYSGLTIFSKHSGAVLGAHQKLDRVARADLSELLKHDTNFPSAREILHFEGLNGPDGIKRKSPAKDEPWHYIDPANEKDFKLTKILVNHYGELVAALKSYNRERAAFEAAWLAHALVDGLTPAHHYPYEEKLSELRGGEGLETRTSFRKKLIMPGATARKQFQNNWRMWGPRGLYTTHSLFEMGVATIILPQSFKHIRLSTAEIADAQSLDVTSWYNEQVQAVAALGIYDRFYKRGWTIKLAKQVRLELAPRLIKVVTLAWYKAALEAGLAEAQA